MHPFSARLTRPSVLAAALGVLVAGGLLGGCDRHRAEDLPESYGHGSSHQKAYDRHENDSLNGSKHFSDSTGVAPGGEEHEPVGTARPGETPASPMFPGDH